MEWWIWLLLVNWGLPLVGCWSYALLALAIGDFVYVGQYGPFAKFRLAYKGMAKWHDRAWGDWGGIGLFGFMAFRDEEGPRDDAWVARTIMHEGTHCWQWLLGLLFLVLYNGHMLIILFFQETKHPYLDCWAERMARRRAGQLIDVPREQWPDGPADRNPWW